MLESQGNVSIEKFEVDGQNALRACKIEAQVEEVQINQNKRILYAKTTAK